MEQYVLAYKVGDPNNQFKDGRPGRTWFKSFMSRNKLSLKKANMICISRKSNIYQYQQHLLDYEVLDKPLQDYEVLVHLYFF